MTMGCRSGDNKETLACRLTRVLGAWLAVVQLVQFDAVSYSVLGCSRQGH